MSMGQIVSSILFTPSKAGHKGPLQPESCSEYRTEREKHPWAVLFARGIIAFVAFGIIKGLLDVHEALWAE
jgi:hypothetical protein